mmetsp:Transcript_13500/g.19910  ORF Transcript_13500/g.19910 Transcript_13500/m.19910 type:complete len:348 (-) Transcript_13500:45-1088(-)
MISTTLNFISLKNDKPGSVTVTIDNLTIALVVASILYGLCLILAHRKIRGLHRIQPELSTRKLLLLSVSVVCAVRLMTIMGVVIMNIANVQAHYSLLPIDRQQSEQDVNQVFYDKAMTVLFDLPNCVVVSTYVLLTMVWAECFLKSRFHTESLMKWKRRGLQLFMIFNSLLYLCQLSLYTSILVATRSLRTYLYAGITGVNFSAVLLVWSLYFYLQFKFSGFPFRSTHLRQSLLKISSVMTLWSVTRLVWGMATLAVFLCHIELLQDSHTPMWSFVVLFLLFVVCEIIPIIAMLDYSYMNMITIPSFLDTTTPGGGYILLDNYPSAPPINSNANDEPAERSSDMNSA